MSISFSVAVAGAEVFDRTFNRVEREIADLRPVWEEVTKEFFQLELEAFRSEGASGASGRWAPLSPKYEEAKARRGFNFMGVLQRTRKLERSLTRKGAEHQVLEEGAQELTVGTTLPYAVMHQRGGGRLKARPPISLSEAGKRRIQKAIQRQLVEYVRRQGLVLDERNIGDFG